MPPVCVLRLHPPLPPSQGNALDMLEDVNTGIAWALRKLERYGGDPERVWLVGQSAGGQLAMLALLNQAAQAATGEAVWGGAPVWHPQGLAGFVGVSEWRHGELVPVQQGAAHIHACFSLLCMCYLLIMLWHEQNCRRCAERLSCHSSVCVSSRPPPLFLGQQVVRTTLRALLSTSTGVGCTRTCWTPS